MRTKKFVAPNYTDALKRVREELGEGALVLSTRSIKFDRKNGGNQCAEMVEITAALEPEPVDSNPVVTESHSSSAFTGESGDFGETNSLVNCLLAHTEKAKVMGLKMEQMNTFKKLIEAGVEEKLAALAFKRINRDKQAETIQGEMLEGELARLMKKALKCPGPIQLGQWGPKVVALVGPTGAGKTTTLAKLAAYFALEMNKNVVLVSLDTYRIGAIEQLEIYGDLMRVPVELAGGRQDLEQILRKYIDRDLVLIDTMGCNPRDINYVGRLQKVFKAAPNMETHLVHSVTCRDDILSQTVKQFSPLGVDRLLFTKLDEGTNYGSLFNASVRYRIPFSYFTTGQRVPEDIEVAGEDQVIRLIFN